MRIFRVNFECWEGKKPGGDDSIQSDVMVVAASMDEAIRKADKHMKSAWKHIYGCMKPLECSLEHEIEVV